MKRMYLRVAVALLLAVALFFTSCSKKGDQGPAGTANVIYSDWVNVNFTPALNTSGDTTAYEGTINVPKLTDSLLKTGEIKVYLNAGTPDSMNVIALPITDYYGLTGVQNINVIFSKGQIYMYATEDPSTFTTTTGKKAFQFRYVLIPGGTKTTSSVNWNNYQAVKQATGMQN